VRRQRDTLLVIVRRQREVGRGIAFLEIAAARPEPHLRRRQRTPDERTGHAFHELPESFRRLQHRPHDDGEEQDVADEECQDPDPKPVQKMPHGWPKYKSGHCQAACATRTWSARRTTRWPDARPGGACTTGTSTRRS